MNRLFLISCVAAKKPEPSAAGELYASTWFRKARKLIQKTGSPWFILSAEHGLLAPGTVIAPYERTLNRMSASERREWAKRVQEQMEESLPKADEVVVLAGNRYRENLMRYLRRRFSQVTVPMEGLTIGRQLSWLDHAASL
jgi:hypothetical protein